MDRSATRNNFLDILLDPTAFAILASLAVHATFGAYLLPIFTKSQPEPKAEPVAVKVVELTPSELQRIPQVPEPLAPTPTPQILPPANRSTATIPNTPSIATTPQTIPISPVRTTPKPKISKPPQAKKSQNPIPQAQPKEPVFNRDISFKPRPTPSKSPNANNRPNPTTTPQPQTTPAPTPKSTPAAAQPQSKPGLDNDGGGQSSPQPSTPQPSPTGKPSGSPNPSPQPTGGKNTGGGLYGDLAQKVTAQLQQYLTKYPNIKVYPPQPISRPYPPGLPCSKVKKSPYIVFMGKFGKIVSNPDNNVLGMDNSSDNDVKVFQSETTEETKQLSRIAIEIAVTEANTAEQNRPADDKDREILRQYQVGFDPATCKK